MTNPYTAFGDYWAAGWRGILPLPYGKKGFPPEGYTGYSGGEPSYADCQAWSEEGNRNLCLRLPDGIVGIDVDHYDGKTGGHTLAGLVAKYGALPPTAYSSSRGDGISGIRLYRVPPGTVLPTKLPGIEFIQRHHRYVVSWPSVHPSGNIYQWIDERTGLTMDAPPRITGIPNLPAAWLDGLAVEAKNRDKIDIDLDKAQAILEGLPGGDPCPHALAAAGKAIAGGDRHDSYNEAALAVLGVGRRGCPGAKPIIARLRAAFVAEVTAQGTTNQRTRSEAEAEWRRGMLGAIAIIAGEPQGSACPDDVYQWVEDMGGDQPAPEADAEQPGEPSPFDQMVRRKAAELRIVEEARELLAAHRAGQAPPLAGIAMPEFLAQPDDEERYRVAGLWPAEGRVLNPAAAKSGKTTLIVGNLIPSLCDGRPFLDKFDVVPVAQRIVYLNLEVGERTLRNWMRRAGVEASEKVTVVNLRGKASAIGLGSGAGRRRFADFLRGEDAEVVLLDPLAPLLASLGLDENSNADVARFFAWWSEALGNAGVVDDFIAHHAGHAGERSRGASRLLDEPDAIWTMTRASIGDEDDVYGMQEMRFLKAMGRDVDLPETALGFDPATGALVLREGMTRQGVKSQGAREAVIAWVRDHPGQSRTTIKEGVGGNAKRVWDAIDELIRDGELLRVGRGWHVD